MSYIVRAEWTAAEGNADLVLQALPELVNLSRAEPGNQIYLPYRDPAHPNVIHIFEAYDDESAFRAHTESAHFQHYVIETVLPLLAARTRAAFHGLDL